MYISEKILLLNLLEVFIILLNDSDKNRNLYKRKIFIKIMGKRYQKDYALTRKICNK